MPVSTYPERLDLLGSITLGTRKMAHWVRTGSASMGTTAGRLSTHKNTK